MMRREASPGVPDLVLERYRLGELPEREARALGERLRDDAELRARLEALDASDAEIRRSHLPTWLADRIRQRLPGLPQDRLGRPTTSRRWALPLAGVAAAALLLVLAPRLVGPPSQGPATAPPVATADRVKGLKPSLELYRKTPDGSEPVEDGALAAAGDLLRVGYRAGGQAFGVILSIDGRGVVTLHLPVRGDRAAPLQGGGTVLLDHAYELDDAPRFERFYLVTAPDPFAVAPVLEAARRATAASEGGELALAAPLEQATFLLRKGGRP